jgi:hypothetical protein
VLVVVVLLMAVGIHSCQVSQTNSALTNYAAGVSTLIGDSHNTSAALFGVLKNPGGAINAQKDISADESQALQQLHQAQSLNPPGQVSAANSKLVLAMQMRYDAIRHIGMVIEQALSKGAASTGAVSAIAGETARLYASDVIYIDYALAEMIAGLQAAGIHGEAINRSQFVPSIQWLQPTVIAEALHVNAPVSNTLSPGTHGHALESVNVGATQLDTGSPNTVALSPAPQFTLNLLNSGTNNEFNVVCKITVTGTSSVGTATVAETYAGKTATCNVALKPLPAAGTYTMVATIEKVPGEKNLANNTLSYTVSFQ